MCDPTRQRVWAICTVCERWNLSGVPETLIPALERVWTASTGRTTEGRIGVTHLAGGVRLVRVDPLATAKEFAAWRFAPVLER